MKQPAQSPLADLLKPAAVYRQSLLHELPPLLLLLFWEAAVPLAVEPASVPLHICCCCCRRLRPSRCELPGLCC